MGFSRSEVVRVVCTVPGVTHVEADTVKPGVVRVRVRVVGGKLEEVIEAVRGIKPAAVRAVVEHQDDAESTIVETFL